AADLVRVQLWRQVQCGVHRVEPVHVTCLIRDPGNINATYHCQQGPAARPLERAHDAVGSLGANRTLCDGAQ
ncbi:MAG: hypothetical protein U0270_42025, partial [Labilithrix sp.]